MKTIAISAIVLSTAFGLANGAQAQEARKLFFEGDIVRHAFGRDRAGPFCVLANQFKRKEVVTKNIRVLEPDGKVADNTVLKSVVVILNNGPSLPARYSGHGMPPTEHYEIIPWEIPADFPAGSLGYKVVAHHDGRLDRVLGAVQPRDHPAPA